MCKMKIEIPNRYQHQNVKAIKENIDEATQLSHVKPYVKPGKLRKRSEVDEHLKAKIFESNT